MIGGFAVMMIVLAGFAVASVVRTQSSPYNVDGVAKDHKPLRKLLADEIPDDAEVIEVHVGQIYGRVVVIEGDQLIEYKFTSQMDQRNRLSPHNMAERRACARSLEDIDLRAVKRIIVDARRRLPKGAEIRSVSWRCDFKPKRWYVSLKSTKRLSGYGYDLDGSRD